MRTGTYAYMRTYAYSVMYENYIRNQTIQIYDRVLLPKLV